MARDKAVVLLSGGIDSATVLYWAKDKGYDCFCLIFNYNQRHKKEIKSAIKLARATLSVYQVVKINLPWASSLPLLSKKHSLPKNRNKEEIIKSCEIPSTYVPARNTIFLSFAISYAETIYAKEIFIGANNIDFSGYPDCRPQYYEIYNKLIEVGTKLGKEIKITAPLMNKTKAEIIRLGIELGVPYELTWSCYAGGRKPCLSCDSCVLRRSGFEEAGIKDPLLEFESYT